MSPVRMWEPWLFVGTEMFCVSGFAVKLAWGTIMWCFYFRGMSLSSGYGNITVLLETLVLEGNTNLESHARKAAWQQSAKIA